MRGRLNVVEIAAGEMVLLQRGVLLLDEGRPRLGRLVTPIGRRRIAGHLLAQLHDVRYVNAVRQRDARDADQDDGQHDAADDQGGHAEAFPAAHGHLGEVTARNACRRWKSAAPTCRFSSLGSEQVFPTYSKNILSIFPLAFYVYYFYLKKIVLMIL